jgi:hypothetical protein
MTSNAPPMRNEGGTDRGHVRMMPLAEAVVIAMPVYEVDRMASPVPVPDKEGNDTIACWSVKCGKFMMIGIALLVFVAVVAIIAVVVMMVGFTKQGNPSTTILSRTTPMVVMTTPSPTPMPVDDTTVATATAMLSTSGSGVGNLCIICLDGTVVDDFTPYADDGDYRTCVDLIDEAKQYETCSDGCGNSELYELLCCYTKPVNPCIISPDGITAAEGEDYVPEYGGNSKTCKDLIEGAIQFESGSDACGLYDIDVEYCCPNVENLASVILEDTTTPPVAAPVATGSLVAVVVTEPSSAGTTLPPVAMTEPLVAGRTSASLIFDVPGAVTSFDAAEIMANEGFNEVLYQVITGFGLLSNEILSMLVPVRKIRGLRASERNLLTLQPVVVTDICELTKYSLMSCLSKIIRASFSCVANIIRFCLFDNNEACPAGVVYAKEGSTCVNFKFTVLPEEMSVETTTTYSEEMMSKINAGELYDTLKTTYPDTFIYGLGNPGAGAPIKTTGLSTTTSTGSMMSTAITASTSSTG